MTTAPAGATLEPTVPLTSLDQLWILVSGTVCNLRCRHCFVSCNPRNHTFWFLSRAQVASALEQALPLGVRSCYFTGGEPFMHRDAVTLIGDALARFPTTVLTNGTLLVPRIVDGLAAVAGASPHPLELRVSLEGVTESANDAIRGAGAFRKAADGLARLVAAGFRPIVTIMQTWPDHAGDAVLADFRSFLGSLGYERPRLQVQPRLHKGEEATRTRAYLPHERVTPELLAACDRERLLCTRARVVTARGVWACPMLLDTPVARLGDTLAQAAAAPATLSESACYTCCRSGPLCCNLPPEG